VHAKPSARSRVPDAYALIEGGKWLRLRLPAVHYQYASDDNRGRNARRQEHSLVHFSLPFRLSDSDPSKQSGGPQRSSVATDLPVAPSPSELPAVHTNAARCVSARRNRKGKRGAGATDGLRIRLRGGQVAVCLGCMARGTSTPCNFSAAVDTDSPLILQRADRLICCCAESPQVEPKAILTGKVHSSEATADSQ
jgi:hypothetical protein